MYAAELEPDWGDDMDNFYFLDAARRVLAHKTGDTDSGVGLDELLADLDMAFDPVSDDHDLADYYKMVRLVALSSVRAGGGS